MEMTNENRKSLCEHMIRNTMQTRKDRLDATVEAQALTGEDCDRFLNFVNRDATQTMERDNGENAPVCKKKENKDA